MVHPVKVPLFTPVQYNPWTLYPALYLSPNCKSIAVISNPLKVNEKGSKGCTSKFYETSFLATVIKVSYCTIIFPLLAILANLVARALSGAFHYLPGEAPLYLGEIGTSNLPSKIEGLTEFRAMCLNAEKDLEYVIDPNNSDFKPEQIYTNNSKYIQKLIDDRQDLLQNVFNSKEVTQPEMNFLRHISKKILLRVVERNKQYAIKNCEKEASLIQSASIKAKKQEEEIICAERSAEHAVLHHALEFMSQAEGVPTSYELMCRTYPHNLLDGSFSQLNIYQNKKGDVKVEIGSKRCERGESIMCQPPVVERSVSVMCHPEKIVLKTKPTTTSIRNPKNWSFDTKTLTVTFQET